jgi:hypothetical protein
MSVVLMFDSNGYEDENHRAKLRGRNAGLHSLHQTYIKGREEFRLHQQHALLFY